MPGEYSDAEVQAMSPDELYKAAQRGFRRLPTDPADRPEYAGQQVLSPLPIGVTSPLANPLPRADGANVWAAKKAGADAQIFICPSGQTCRVREVQPEQLMLTGILDKVTRLEGLAETLVASAEGQPPKADRLPTREEFEDLRVTINQVVVLAVVEPALLPDPVEGETIQHDRLYVSDIDLSDRMAIMEHALRRVKALDNFRNAG